MGRAIVRKLWSAMDELAQCCEVIKESKQGCEACPLNFICIERTSVSEFIDLGTFSTIDEFLDAADELSSYNPTQEEYEADEWNVRRCDPDED